MHSDVAAWSFGLLFASLSSLLGMIGVVTAARSTERSLVIGHFIQGIALLFVVGGTYYGRSTELHLGGLAAMSLLILHTLFSPETIAEDPSSCEDELQ